MPNSFAFFVRLLIHLDAYHHLDDVAMHYAGEEEETSQANEEIVMAAFDTTEDAELTRMEFRILLTEHVDIRGE